jgi:hypothetical protein
MVRGLLPLMLACLLLAVAAPAAAQAPGQSMSAFVLRTPHGPEKALRPGAQANVTIPWEYVFNNAAAATASTLAAGSTTIHWNPAPACDGEQVTLTGALSQTVRFNAGQTAYEGQADFKLHVDRDAERATLTCTFVAYADAVSPFVPQTPPASSQIVVDVDGRMPAQAAAETGSDAEPAQASPGAGPLVILAVFACALVARLRRA